MSEATLQTSLQTILRTVTGFASADIVINDWGVLDQSSAAAPYVIISNADNFTSRQDTTSANTKWQIPLTLVERFTDWDETLNNLRTRRQAIIDTFNAVGDNRSADGLEATTVDEIRNEGPITPYYGPYLRAEELPEALPQFLMQTIVLSVEEF